MRRLVVEVTTLDLAPVCSWHVDLEEVLRQPGVGYPIRLAVRARVETSRDVLPPAPVEIP